MSNMSWSQPSSTALRICSILTLKGHGQASGCGNEKQCRVHAPCQFGSQIINDVDTRLKIALTSTRDYYWLKFGLKKATVQSKSVELQSMFMKFLFPGKI